MPRHFTPADREYALERLVANRGDVARTASELGISASALYRWRKSRIDSQFSLSFFSPNLSVPKAPETSDSKSLSVNGEGFREGFSGLPTDDADALRDLKARMLDLARILSTSIEAAIEAAPLGQRIAGLTQLIDRIIKLAAQLPEEEVQYVLSDDVEEEHDIEENSPAYSSYRSEGGFEE